MSNARPSAIIWDLDGTLVDSVSDLAAALNGVLRQHGLVPRSVDAVRGMIGDGVTELLRRGFAAAGTTLASAELPALRRRFLALYSDQATRNTRPMPGATEVLAELSEQGCRHAVCTNKPVGIACHILSALGLNRWIETVVGGDAGLPLKPDPAPVRACLDALGMRPDRALMVGDSANDLAAGRAAGVSVVFARYGYGETPTEQTAPAASIDGLDEMLRIARGLTACGGIPISESGA